jgi:hypothetical protein
MYCPSCGSEYREGYTDCPDCKVSLVERLPNDAPQRRREPMFPTIPKPPDDRPFLLKVIPFLAFILGGGALLMLLLGLCDAGTFTSAGRVISSKEFLSQAALPMSGLALVCFAVAFVFWREEPWSRHLLIACLILVASGQLWLGHAGTELLEIGPFTLDLGIPSGLVYLALACWYFYAKTNVRAYYQDLHSH